MNDWIIKQLVGGMPALAARLQWWADNFRFRMAQGVGRLKTSEWTVKQFQEFGRKELKDTLYGIAETGLGRRLTRKEQVQVRSTLKTQIGYWDRFAQAIVDQRQALAEEGLKGAELEEAFNSLYAKFTRRAQSYAGAVEAEGAKWAMASQYKDGQWFQWVLDPLLENCPDCQGRDGEIRQMQDGKLPYYPRDGSTVCFFQADKVRVLTRERCYIRLASVKEGEHVLTHKGRWQKVIGLTRIKVKDVAAVALEITFGEKPVKITVTSDHLLFSDGDWVRADSLKCGDSIGRMGRECAHDGCNEVVHLGRKDSLEYCSHRCAIIGEQKWKRANARVRQMVVDGIDPLTRWRSNVTNWLFGR